MIPTNIFTTSDATFEVSIELHIYKESSYSLAAALHGRYVGRYPAAVAQRPIHATSRHGKPASVAQLGYPKAKTPP